MPVTLPKNGSSLRLRHCPYSSSFHKTRTMTATTIGTSHHRRNYFAISTDFISNRRLFHHSSFDVSAALHSSSSAMRSPSLFTLGRRWHGSSQTSKLNEDGTPKETITIRWKLDDDSEVETEVVKGTTILEAAHENDIELEGACESSLACSTCHVILEPEIYDALEEPSEDEWDMLDLAFGLTDTSRLGCQVAVTPLFKNTLITLPKATRNFAVDGFKPKPH